MDGMGGHHRHSHSHDTLHHSPDVHYLEPALGGPAFGPMGSMLVWAGIQGWTSCHGAGAWTDMQMNCRNRLQM